MTKLTNVQKEFLKIVNSFLHGNTYALPENFKEMPELYKLASDHHLAAAVYEQIRTDCVWQNPEWRLLGINWKRSTVKQVMLQTQRTEGFLTLYKKLLEADIQPLIVKGLVCRNMYQKPDYRTSGDEDIVIKRELVQIADQIFQAEGFSAKDEGEDKFKEQTISYINSQNGVFIEVQPDLFNEEFATLNMLNKGFDDMFETCIAEKIQGIDIYTLEPTKHFLYLIYHAFKHFLAGGFGIRQVCDIFMMADRYDECIDWELVKTRLEEYSLDGFYKGLEQIAINHLGFKTRKMDSETIDYVSLLLDLLDAGSFGYTSAERKDSTSVTFMAVEKSKKSGKEEGDNFLFPNMEYMKKSVPWLEKYPWLLPVGYIVRIVRYLRRSTSKNDNEKNSIQIGTERVELMKKYGIIK